MGLLDILHYSWQANQSPETAKFPIVTLGPWIVVVVLTCYYFAIKQAHKIRREHDLNLNPLLIPYFGFFFGCYFVGSIVGVVVTDYLKISFKCGTLSDDPFMEMILTYLGFVFFCFQILHLFDSVFLIMNDDLKQVSNAHILEKVILFVRSYVDLKFFPGGIGSFLPMIFAICYTIQSSYLIRFFSSTELRPAPGWQRKISGLKSVAWLTVFIHNYYAFYSLNCSSSSLLKATSLSQSLVLFLFFGREYLFVVGAARNSKGRKSKDN